MITRLDLGTSTRHPGIGIEAIGAAATGSSGVVLIELSQIIDVGVRTAIGEENPTMRALVLGIAVLAVSAASASADGYGHRHHYGYYRSYYHPHYYDYGYFRVYAGLYGGGYRPWGWRGWW